MALAEGYADRFVEEYWKYYLGIEKDFLESLRYVEFERRNFATYSREFKKMLDVVGSEVDVVGKSIAELCDPDDKKLEDASILHWGFVVQSYEPRISHMEVVARQDMRFVPWKNWANEYVQNKRGNWYYRLKPGSENPEWWKSYNKSKHRRKSLAHPDQSSYERASLRNVINALAGLFLLECILGRIVDVRVDQLEMKSDLFKDVMLDV